MENSTPFDLNDAISRWRANLASSASYSPADLDELQAHLEDSVADLKAKSLSTQEAFWVAVHRLGNPEALACEFSKVNLEQIWLTRTLWMVTGFLALGAISSIAHNLTSLATITAHHLTLKGNLLGLLSLLFSQLLLPILLVVIWRSGRSSGSFLWRVAAWAKNHPFFSGLGMLLLPALTSLLSFVLNTLMLKSMPMETYGVLMQWRVCGIAVPMLLWPIVLTWLLILTSRGSRTSMRSSQGRCDC